MVVLYPSCHTSVGDVGGVQKILQEVRFDQVCTELCEERLAKLTGYRSKLAGRNTFLKTDIAKVLRSLEDKEGGSSEGMDMVTVVLEGDRHKIPVIGVDRSVQVTMARFRASVQWPAVRFLLFPLVTRLMDIAELVLLPKEIPTDRLLALFSRSFQLPWHLRQKILRSTVGSDGTEAVPRDVLTSVLHEFYEAANKRAGLSPEDLKAEAQSDRFLPMPHGMETLLGHESTIDVFARVISAERDAVIAHNIATMTAPSATHCREGRVAGPLVFAVVGAAHLDPVARYLRESKEELSRMALAALEKPFVPWWKERLLSMRRLLTPFRLVMQPFELPRRSSGELAWA